MPTRTVEALLRADVGEAVEIADRVWWVGQYLQDDDFQCHAYLIEHGDQSVLLDPGSRLTFRETLRKVEQVVPLAAVRYLVCHHADPDIVGAIPLLDELVARRDAMLVSHGRARALLKHLGVRLPCWCVDEHDWQLDLGGRRLRFVFTPYMHFPGAFCTFDEASGVLFSSDIFGGFTDRWSLVASDTAQIDSLRTFHEHYMPSREIVQSGVQRLRQLPVEMIAPQHGSLIPRELVSYAFEQLEQLDCGLYLMAGQRGFDVRRLSAINSMVRQLMRTMALYRDFKEVAGALLELVQGLVPARSIEFFLDLERDTTDVLYLGPRAHFRAVRIPRPRLCGEVMGSPAAELERLGHTIRVCPRVERVDGSSAPALLLPLVDPEGRYISALAVIGLDEVIEVDAETEETLMHVRLPLEMAIERERIHRLLELERQEVYERSVRDPLTGLYTRYYLYESAKRLIDLHDRDPSAPVGVVIFDVDHFKRINDSFGHGAGDEVLRRVADVMRSEVRESDILVRFGGEELLVLLAGVSALSRYVVAERVRYGVHRMCFGGPMQGYDVTVSAGCAIRRPRESLEQVIDRADAALYQAKRSGRNRVATDEYPTLRA